ncbi:MAG: hypothetical protein L0226_11160 [Acidobacteria bacterium]|nr:hypothetical protein [Acidobacteriota bacterium]
MGKKKKKRVINNQVSRNVLSRKTEEPGYFERITLSESERCFVTEDRLTPVPPDPREGACLEVVLLPPSNFTAARTGELYR